MISSLRARPKRLTLSSLMQTKLTTTIITKSLCCCWGKEASSLSTMWEFHLRRVSKVFCWYTFVLDNWYICCIFFRCCGVEGCWIRLPMMQTRLPSISWIRSCTEISGWLWACWPWEMGWHWQSNFRFSVMSLKAFEEHLNLGILY